MEKGRLPLEVLEGQGMAMKERCAQAAYTALVLLLGVLVSEGPPFPARGPCLLAELRETENHVIYGSEPDRDMVERFREEEREKQEKSWDMLRNMVIVPESRDAPRHLPPTNRNPQSNSLP